MMKSKYSDDNLRTIMSTATIHNEVIDTRIAETLADIKRQKVNESEGQKQPEKRKPVRSRQASGKKRNTWKKIAYGIGTVAAVLFLSVGICAANPSLAENIPILGNVFMKVQDIFSFGRIPEDETTKLYENGIDASQNDSYEPADGKPDTGADAMEENQQGTGASEEAGSRQDFLYRDYDNGITVTITEYYASNQAVFFGVVIESEEEFPQFAVMGDSNYQLVQAFTRERYSFRDSEVGGVRHIEGRLEGAHTFAGIMRVDYDDINIDGSNYEAACREAEAKGEELPTVTAETWDLYYERMEVPDEFEAQFTIESLRGYCRDDVQNGNQYRVRGSWEFPPCRIEKSMAAVQTIQIHEVNEQGIGLDTIDISPIELTLHTTEPSDCLTFAVALDKDGRKLASGSSNAYELATTGHDISTITVYICDYDEYMNEIKAYALEDEETFRKLLEERALFKKTVDIR